MPNDIQEPDSHNHSAPEKQFLILSETHPGIHLAEQHAKMIWQGNKDLIIRPKNFKFSVGKPFYLIGGNECFGVITIKKITQINLKEFDDLSGRHRISNGERKKWWAGKQQLYRYDFSVDEKFERPKLVKIPLNTQTFVQNVEFVVGNATVGMIKDVVNYNPSSLRASQLRDDFRIAMAWHASKASGKKIPYSNEEIENLIQLIMEELLRRGTEFHPDKMPPHSKKVYEKIMDRIVTQTMSEPEPVELELMTQAFGSPGGKLHLASKILSAIPEHKTYVEPFAGGAAVFWKKGPSEIEVLNDGDPEIAFAYRFIRDHTPGQLAELGKKEWNANKKLFFSLLNLEKPKNDIERFHKFMYTTHHSFGTNRKTFAYKFRGHKYKPCLRMKAAKERLRNVMVLNKDYKEAIRRFDSPDTFFFIDPPYPGEWPGPGGSGMWKKKDVEELSDLLVGVKGKFLVTLNNLPWIREAFKKNNFKTTIMKNQRYFRHTTGDKFELIATNYDIREGKKTKKLSHRPQFIDEFKDMVLVKDAVSIVGSSVESNKYGDIDVLVRLKEPSDYIKRAIGTRITKSLPEKIAEQLHFIWGDAEGPHDDHVPLYDLSLVKKKSRLVEMADSGSMAHFAPMKPKKSFYRVNEILDYMYKNGENEKYEIEKKYNGFRAVIHKKGDKVKILSDQLKDITFPFPTIVKQALALSKEDFIIDCELVPFANGIPQGRAVASRYIGAVKSHKDIDDSNVKFYAFDVVYFGRDVSGEPWNERYKILRKLNFGDNIKEVAGVVVSNRAEAKKAIRMFRSMRGSEGAIIKRFDGKYEKGKESDEWIKFRNKIEMRGRITDKVSVKGANAWGYVLAIDLKGGEKGKINPKFTHDDMLKLGKTFNTKIDAKKGDILDVLVEEVWRHESKDGKVRYSIHKPNPLAISKKKKTTSLTELDAAVVSRGVAVREYGEGDSVLISADPNTELIDELMGKRGTVLEKLDNECLLVAVEGLEEPTWFSSKELVADDEGREKATPDLTDFPKKMQDDFKAVMKSGKWLPFVFQWHYRGHKITEDEYKDANISRDFKYWLKSLHTDTRYDVGGHLQGITLLNPTTTDRQQEDKVGPNLSNVRAVIKLPQPKGWLNVEGISPAGDPGTTRKAPAVFAIVAKGKYRPVVVEDHRIILEMDEDKGKTVSNLGEKVKGEGIYMTRFPPAKLKELPKYISYHIAHIENRHIILVDGMEKVE